MLVFLKAMADMLSMVKSEEGNILSVALKLFVVRYIYIL